MLARLTRRWTQVDGSVLACGSLLLAIYARHPACLPTALLASTPPSLGVFLIVPRWLANNASKAQSVNATSSVSYRDNMSIVDLTSNAGDQR